MNPDSPDQLLSEERSKEGLIVPQGTVEKMEKASEPRWKKREKKTTFRLQICIVCRKPEGTLKAFELPFVGAVHQACLTHKKGFILKRHKKSGSKVRFLMGDILTEVMKPVEPPKGVLALEEVLDQVHELNEEEKSSEC